MSDRIPLRPLFALAMPLTAATVLAFLAAPASAHGHIEVHPYEFTVGWTDEPPVVGSPNGLDLGVQVHIDENTTEPVVGVAGNLTATLMYGGLSAVHTVSPQFGNPGWYTFEVIPSRVGEYTVRITGTINGTAINFTAELADPAGRSDLEFPVADPSPHDLQEALDDAEAALAREHANSTALAARVAALEMAPPASGGSTAMLMGAAGLAAGAAGILVGVMALRKGKAPK